MNVRVLRRGPAGKYEMWDRCRDPQRWPTWMTAVRDVDASGDLRPGLDGSIVLAGGVRARFEVVEVNVLGPSWTCRLLVGSIRIEIEHRVDEGFGLVEISAPAPVALACVPVVRRSLSRLLRRG